MKSQINFKSIAMFVAIILVTLTTTAQTVSGKNTAIAAVAETKPELQVKFLGASGEYLYFELTMLQADDNRSNLRIRNEHGSELYTETFFQKSSVRKLKIEKGEAEKLEFVYNNGRGEAKKLVEIKIKYQETVEVNDIARL